MKNETIYKKMRSDKHPGLHDIGCHGACCLRATDLGLQLGETTVFEHVTGSSEKAFPAFINRS